MRGPLLLELPGTWCLWQGLGLHLHGRKQIAESGERVWYLGCFNLTGFKQDSDFFFGGILLIFAWMFFSFSAQFFTFLMLLSFLTFHHHLSLICLYLPSVSLYPFPVHYKTNGNPHTVAFPFPWKQNIHCFFLKSLGHCLINSAPQFLRIYLFAVITQSTSKCLSESSNTQHLPEEH